MHLLCTQEVYRLVSSPLRPWPWVFFLLKLFRSGLHRPNQNARLLRVCLGAFVMWCEPTSSTLHNVGSMLFSTIFDGPRRVWKMRRSKTTNNQPDILFRRRRRKWNLQTLFSLLIYCCWCWCTLHNCVRWPASFRFRLPLHTEWLSQSSKWSAPRNVIFILFLSPSCVQCLENFVINLSDAGEPKKK